MSHAESPGGGEPGIPASAPALDAVAATGPLAAIYEGTLDCVHCGLCLPACPTYRVTGREVSSPRGRIYLMRAAAEGRIPFGDALAGEAYLCLDCRACETACPSGVRFGSLVEGTRAAVEAAGLRRGPARALERFALRRLLPRRRRLRALFLLLRWMQRVGLDRLAARLLPGRAGELLRIAPRVPPARERRPLPGRIAPLGEPRGRVGLLIGCVMAELYGRVHTATARVLAANGFEVVVPPGQGCCGALHAHAGDPAWAERLAREAAERFRRAGVGEVVTDAAGCGAALREAWAGSAGDGAEAAAPGLRDVSAFLDDAGLRPPPHRVDLRVCYDDPCHLVHAQGVREAPRRLLAAIPGLELLSHADAESCCGAAGIYNLTHPAMSRAILARKLDALAALDPDVIATGNPGCMMQLARGVAERGLRAEVLHPVELLDRAYGERGSAPD